MNNFPKSFIRTLTISMLVVVFVMSSAWAQGEIIELIKSRLSSDGKTLDFSHLKGKA